MTALGFSFMPMIGIGKYVSEVRNIGKE